MSQKLKVLGINGSASQNSSNLSLLKLIAEKGKADFDLEIVDDLADLPHFRTELTNENVPAKIIAFRNKVSKADGIIICTPEYVFSIPSALKNAIEWSLSTVIFSEKPTGLITASASGQKGHEELKLIMKTVQTNFTEDTSLLIQGVKGKFNEEKELTDVNTQELLDRFVASFIDLLKSKAN